MIAVIFGPYGPFTDFCRDVCVDVLRAIGRQTNFVEVSAPGLRQSSDQEVNQLGEVAAAALKADNEALVAVCRVPTRQLVEAVDASELPYFVVLDDPRRTTAFLVRAGYEPLMAIRSVSLSSAALMQIKPTQHRLRMHWDAFSSTEFSRSVAQFLRLPSNHENLGAINKSVDWHLRALQSEPTASPDLQTLLDATLAESAMITVKGALSPYADAFRGTPLGRIIITRNMFATNETSDHQVGSVLDVTGRERCLVFGPYLALPPGKWTLRLVLAFSPEVSGTPFSVDVIAPMRGGVKDLGKVTFSALGGRYVAQLTFLHTSLDTPLEIRLFLDKATFEGRVSLGYAELERADDSKGIADEAIDWPAL